jgi:hypothetical protein
MAGQTGSLSSTQANTEEHLLTGFQLHSFLNLFFGCAQRIPQLGSK